MATVAARMNTPRINPATAANGPGAQAEDGDPAGRVWTVAAIRALGMTTDIETAASILGFGRTKAYELAKRGQFPVPTLRIGRRYLVPIPAILHLLDAD